MNWKANVTCNLSCFIETEGHLKVTCSHVHHRSVDVSETVQDRDVVTTDRE